MVVSALCRLISLAWAKSLTHTVLERANSSSTTINSSRNRELLERTGAPHGLTSTAPQLGVTALANRFPDASMASTAMQSP